MNRVFSSREVLEKMDPKIRLACIFLALIALFAPPVFAGSAKPGAVTILTDELANPGSRVSQMLKELAQGLNAANRMRALLVSGDGSVGNIRDLMDLRGIDFAVVNSDIFGYLDLTKTLPDARTRVRLVSPLFDQYVFLLARGQIRSVNDMKGKSVGILSGCHTCAITAQTIFGLQNIEVKVEQVAPAAHPNASLDAYLVYDKDLEKLNSLGVTAGEFQLLPIPVSGALGKVYREHRFEKVQFGGFSAQNYTTVSVTTVLATYNWSVSGLRYGDVTSFLKQYFAQIPNLKRRDPQSSFRQTYVKQDVIGWQRFAPAATYFAAVQEAKRPSPPTSFPPVEAVETLRIVAVARPPLTDPHSADGGVALKLLTDALAKSRISVVKEWVDDESALIDKLRSGKTSDAGFFWLSFNCEAPNELSVSQADFCDQMRLSAPVMQVVMGVFARLDLPLHEDGTRRVICMPQTHSILSEKLGEIGWLKTATARYVRPKTIADCLAMIERREANVLVAVEAEANFTIEKLKFGTTLQLVTRVSSPVGLHAFVAKNNPQGGNILTAVNDSVAKLKETEEYNRTIASHLKDLMPSVKSGL